MITQIIIVRHGESRGNLENRFRGRVDYELNETGLTTVFLNNFLQCGKSPFLYARERFSAFYLQ